MVSVYWYLFFFGIPIEIEIEIEIGFFETHSPPVKSPPVNRAAEVKRLVSRRLVFICYYFPISIPISISIIPTIMMRLANAR